MRWACFDESHRDFSRFCTWCSKYSYNPHKPLKRWSWSSSRSFQRHWWSILKNPNTIIIITSHHHSSLWPSSRCIRSNPHPISLLPVKSSLMSIGQQLQLSRYHIIIIPAMRCSSYETNSMMINCNPNLYICTCLESYVIWISCIFISYYHPYQHYWMHEY